MKSMVWIPNPDTDAKHNQYLDQMNHAPYEVLAIIIVVSFLALTCMVLIGSF